MLRNRVLSVLILFIFTLVQSASLAQDSTTNIPLKRNKITRFENEMHYDVGNGKTLIYSKPRKWSFITNLPKDAGSIVSTTVKKDALKPWLVIAASTGLFLLTDDDIINGVGKFSSNIGLDASEKNYNFLTFKLGSKEVVPFRLPANLNTAFYQAGQGFPSLVIGAGLYTYGKIHNDYRALSTSSQLAEAFILMGVGSQMMKRISGRESPSNATVKGGRWQPFPSFSAFQNNTPEYDAFPSGHLATLMSTITIFAENYPEKKWIKPVGYSITGLVAYSMINNKVHWASDYPFALGMGYLCARQVAKRNRRVVTNKTAAIKRKGELNYTINYLNGTLMPGFVYTFN